jgi:uncharacterized protein (TIGR02646 family)
VIRLDRGRFKVPASWPEAVRKAFPNQAAFEASALAFEALALDHPDRRAGFKRFAPEVLPLRGRKKQEREFKAIWGRLKRALAAMSHQKCAYCETPINAERSAAVEHFRPKSLFPRLAYDCGNYFLGCGGCNGAKADRWPAGGSAYVRPDEGDPGASFRFAEDGTVEATSGDDDARHTIDDLDLKRGWLCDIRAKDIQKVLEDLRDLLAEPGIPKETRRRMARRYLDRLADPGLAYSAALTQCFRRAWRESDLGGLD